MDVSRHCLALVRKPTSWGRLSLGILGSHFEDNIGPSDSDHLLYLIANPSQLILKVFSLCQFLTDLARVRNDKTKSSTKTANEIVLASFALRQRRNRSVARGCHFQVAKEQRPEPCVLTLAILATKITGLGGDCLTSRQIQPPNQTQTQPNLTFALQLKQINQIRKAVVESRPPARDSAGSQADNCCRKTLLEDPLVAICAHQPRLRVFPLLV